MGAEVGGLMKIFRGINNSGQDEGTGIDTLCFLTNQKKDNNKFKNKKQPELPEN